MAGPVSDTDKLTYQRNVELAVQQRTSRFEMGFTYRADLKGRAMQMVDLIEPTTAIIDGIRGGDTPNIDVNHEPVWCKPRQIEWGKLIEKEDAIKALTDYQGPYTQDGAAAIVRGRDGVFSSSIVGPRLIGLDSATSSNFANPNGTVANTVGSADGATPTGMNVRKLNRAMRFFRAVYVEVDYEEFWCVVNAQGMEELYNDIITINTDYRKMAVLDELNRTVARVGTWNIVSYESMPDVDANNFGAAAWVRSGMLWGDFWPLQTDAEPNPAKKFRIQTYMENWWGATRSEDQKVVQIANFKNPAGPNG